MYIRKIVLKKGFSNFFDDTTEKNEGNNFSSVGLIFLNTKYLLEHPVRIVGNYGTFCNDDLVINV